MYLPVIQLDLLYDNCVKYQPLIGTSTVYYEFLIIRYLKIGKTLLFYGDITEFRIYIILCGYSEIQIYLAYILKPGI